jgi:hypothetical protein
MAGFIITERDTLPTPEDRFRFGPRAEDVGWMRHDFKARIACAFGRLEVAPSERDAPILTRLKADLLLEIRQRYRRDERNGFGPSETEARWSIAQYLLDELLPTPDVGINSKEAP